MDELAGEAALLDEPGGANLIAIVTAIDWVAFILGDVDTGFVEIDILKERAGAGAL